MWCCKFLGDGTDLQAMGFALSDAAKTRIIVGFAGVQVVATAAVMFGWPAILVVFKDEGQYDELCPDESSSLLSSSAEEQRPKQRGLAKCNAQEVQLNLIFTVSYLFNAVSSLSGPAFDIIGPRISNLVGAVVCRRASLPAALSCPCLFCHCSRALFACVLLPSSLSSQACSCSRSRTRSASTASWSAAPALALVCSHAIYEIQLFSFAAVADAAAWVAAPGCGAQAARSATTGTST